MQDFSLKIPWFTYFKPISPHQDYSDCYFSARSKDKEGKGKKKCILEWVLVFSIYSYINYFSLSSLTFFELLENILIFLGFVSHINHRRCILLLAVIVVNILVLLCYASHEEFVILYDSGRFVFLYYQIWSCIYNCLDQTCILRNKRMRWRGLKLGVFMGPCRLVVEVVFFFSSSKFFSWIYYWHAAMILICA